MSELWHERERARFESGEYKLVPWFAESWWAEAVAGPLALHFTHASVKAGALIAYTENDAKGAADRQTRTKPGRYLARFCPHLTPDQIRGWAGIFASENEENVLLLATTADTIEEVYTSGPRSCMSCSAEPLGTPIHPTRVYAAGDLAVAYIRRDGEITARSLVWPEKHLCSRVYGDEGRLVPLLEAAGYTSGPLLGARLLRVPYGDEFVCPYLDYTGTVTDRGDYLVIDSDGELGAQSTGGCTENQNQEACSNCSDRFDSYEINYYDAVGGSLCESCASELVSYCERCEESVHRDNARYVESVSEVVCDDCLGQQFTTCDECSEPHLDESVIEVTDGSVCTPCLDNNYSHCDACETYVRESTNVDNHCEACASDKEEAEAKEEEEAAVKLEAEKQLAFCWLMLPHTPEPASETTLYFGGTDVRPA